MYDANGAALVIRPMGIGEILDTGFRLARNHYRFLVMLVARILVPAWVVAAILNLILIPGNALSSLIVDVGYFFTAIALTIACARLIKLTEMSPDLQSNVLYDTSLGRVLPSIPVAIILGLTAVIFPFLTYFFVRWSMGMVEVAVEGAGPFEALGRSWDLTRGRWWHVFGVIVVAAIVIILVSIVIGAIFGGIGAIFLFALGSLRLLVLFSTLGSVLGTLLISPFSAAISVVLFYELKARTEGNDLAERARQLPPLE